MVSRAASAAGAGLLETQELERALWTAQKFIPGDEIVALAQDIVRTQGGEPISIASANAAHKAKIDYRNRTWPARGHKWLG